MQKGYYKDILDTRFHGGKTWIAPKVLIKEDVRNCSCSPFGVPDSTAQKALYLPNLYGKALKENVVKHSTLMCFGKITILGLLGTRISEVCSFSNRHFPT
jgi:mitochondrial ATPase complex subunit ATP10